MNIVTRIWNAVRPVLIKAANQAWQVALPVLIAAGIAGVTREVAVTAAVAGVSVLITAAANAVRAWRTYDQRLIAVKSGLSAGLSILTVAGAGVVDVAVWQAALSAAVLSCVTAALSYGQATTGN